MTYQVAGELVDAAAEDWTMVASAVDVVASATDVVGSGAEEEAGSGLEEGGSGLEAATLEVAAGALLEAWVVGAEAGVVTVNEAWEAIVPS